MSCSQSSLSGNIRKHHVNKRKSLSASARHWGSQTIVKQLTASHLYQTSKHIALYLPLGGEVDLSALFKLAQQDHKQLYLPRVNGQQIDLCAVSSVGQLVRSNWGILEPDVSQPSVKLSVIDLLIMPLVAYSHKGDRIGMGGGFYDRLLAQPEQQPIKLGAAYHWQHATWLPESWDQPLDAVITERGIKYF